MLISVLTGIAFMLIFIIAFLFFFPIVIIYGPSMLPTYEAGEIYLSKLVFKKSQLQVGQVYVYKPPYADKEIKYVIKRLKEINDYGDLFFEGDNKSESYDSRNYGYVKPKNVISKVTKVRILSNEKNRV